MNSVAKKKRNQKNRQGFSLMELLVVIGIIAILIGLSMPAINAMQKSYNSTGTESMISAALSTARTLAISNHTYAGVRFQKAGDPNDVLNADQYMIFIVYEEPRKMNNVTDAFRAIEGYRPMKLPSNIGVLDMTKIVSDADVDSDSELYDATTFSIVFSSAGRLVNRLVRTKEINSSDDIFNTDPNIGMFIRDGVHEASRNKFVIYDRDKFNTLVPGQRFTRYLQNLPVVYINAYTGEIIQ